MVGHTLRSQIIELFQSLDARIEDMNQRRREGGIFPLPTAKVRLLGQISLLVHEKASAILNLTQTADLDATIEMDHAVKEELQLLLRKHGYVYDEDRHLIWIPKGAAFLPFVELDNIIVESIDPESALVSKAVRAPEKNKQLIRQAITANLFPNLVERILKSGGKLEDFT